MARGKGGLSSNVVLVTTRRRAASVPAEPITLSNYSYTPATYRRAQRISHDLTDDSDTIRSASKRQDQRLLDNVNNTMKRMELDMVRPGPDVAIKTGFRRYLYGQRYPPIEKDEAKKQRRKDELMYPWDYTHDNFYRDKRGKSKAKEDPEEKGQQDEEVEVKKTVRKSRKDLAEEDVPLPKPTSSASDEDFEKFLQAFHAKTRSLLDLPTATSGVLDEAAFRSRPRARSVFPFEPLSARDYNDQVATQINPKISSQLRQSHEDLYNYGRMLDSKFPSRPHFRVPRQYGRSRTTSLIPDDLDSQREYGSYGSSPYDADIYDYDDEPPIRHTTITPVRSTASTGFLRSSAPVVTRRTHSRPPTVPRASASPTRAHRLAEIEARIDRQTMSQAEPVVSYNTLRTRASNARDKMDVHKVMMDRYLPIHMGPVNEVQHEVLQKYGELEQRMPSLQPYRPSRDVVTRSSSVPPYRPPPSQVAGGDRRKMYGEAMRVQPFTPSMSDTRKRCREVLCKTKRDPHYFDY